MSRRIALHSLLTAFLTLFAAIAFAADTPPSVANEQGVANENTELAKASQNPIANLISLPFQNNTNFGVGPGDEAQNILNIQPVWPFEVTEKLTLIARTILPVVSQPGGPGGARTAEACSPH